MCLVYSHPFLVHRLNTFIIIVFHWSFAQDLSGYYIAELTEEDGGGGKERRQLKKKMDQE